MQTHSLLFSFVLIVSCEIFESSDIDENSTFFERFDGVGFENEDGNITFYFNENIPTTINVDLSVKYQEQICIKCITQREGENLHPPCATEQGVEVKYNITITENTYNRLVVFMDNYRFELSNGDIVETQLGYVSIIEVIDDNTLVSKLTPNTIDLTGSLDTLERTLTRTDIEFSSINCDEI